MPPADVKPFAVDHVQVSAECNIRKGFLESSLTGPWRSLVAVEQARARQEERCIGNRSDMRALPHAPPNPSHGGRRKNVIGVPT